jgi:hypothetical protein
LDGLAFDLLDTEEASCLELPFEEREVLEVVKSVNRDKAPMAFQDCRDVIQTYIMGVFSDFREKS